MPNNNDMISDLMNAGSDIMNSVDKALSTGDFSHLSSDVSQSVTRVSRNVAYRQNVYRGQQQNRTNMGYRNGQPLPGQHQPGYRNQNNNPYTRQPNNYGRPQQQVQYQQRQAINRRPQSPFFVRKVSRNSGLAGIVMGSMMAGFWGLCSIALFAPPASSIGGGIFFGALTALHIWMIVKGCMDKKLAQRYYIYGGIIGMNTYFSIDELALRANIPKEDVLKDIQKMMKKGMLPQARLDKDNTTIMLTPEVFQQYMNVQANQKAMEEAAAAAKAQEESMSPAEREMKKIMDEGDDYIKAIRDANDAIPDDAMSDKLDRLENIMKRIFSEVKRQPESAKDLRRLMDYYLPTTKKLLDAYISLDRQPEVGENITNTKKQIEDATDTINDAFEKLLDSMFEDMAWDVSSDISVMQTMMRQDGLTGESIRDTVTSSQGNVPEQTSSSQTSNFQEKTSGPTLQFGNETYSDPVFSDQMDELAQDGVQVQEQK